MNSKRFETTIILSFNDVIDNSKTRFELNDEGIKEVKRRTRQDLANKVKRGEITFNTSKDKEMLLDSIESVIDKVIDSQKKIIRL